MESDIFERVSQAAGVAGVALFVFLSIFRELLKKDIFPKLATDQAFSIIRLLMIMTLIVTLFGVSVWGAVQWRMSGPGPAIGEPTKPLVHYIYDGDHCPVLPLLTLFSDGSAILDISVVDADFSEGVARMRGTWERVFGNYGLTFEGGGPVGDDVDDEYFRENFLNVIRSTKGNFAIPVDTSEITLWGCYLNKVERLSRRDVQQLIGAGASLVAHGYSD